MMNLIREKNTPAYCDKKKTYSPRRFISLFFDVDAMIHVNVDSRRQQDMTERTNYLLPCQIFFKKQRQKMVQFVTSLQYKLFL